MLLRQERRVTVDLNQSGHVRIGWAQGQADMDLPCGCEHWSYAYRDVEGTRFNNATPKAYAAPYATGDVIGCRITLPDASGGSTALDGVVEILSAETNTTSAVPRPSIAYEDPTQRLATGCEARTAAQGSLYVLPRLIEVPPGEEPDAPDAPLMTNTSACGPPS